MKFGAGLLQRQFSQLVTDDTSPDGAQLIAERLGDNRSWRRVDLAVYGVIGGEPHLHGPAGRHLHLEMNQRRGYSLHT